MVVIVGGRRWVQGGRAETASLLVVEGAKPLHLLPRSGIRQRSWHPAGGSAGSQALVATATGANRG